MTYRAWNRNKGFTADCVAAFMFFNCPSMLELEVFSADLAEQQLFLTSHFSMSMSMDVCRTYSDLVIPDLCHAQAAVKEYVASDAHKQERRDIDKQLTKVTQQISGTRYIVSSVPYSLSEFVVISQSGPVLLELLHAISFRYTLPFA